jgi:hypothetical protein
MGLLDSLLGSKPEINVKKSIAQQQQAGVQAARATQDVNAISSTGPFGGVSFQRDAQGQVTGQTTTLQPGLQQTLTGAAGAAGALAGQGPTQALDFATIPQGQDLASNFFNQQKALLDPGFQQARQDLAVNLENRGLREGGEAFTRETGNLARQQALALQQAAFGGVQLTPQEEQRQISNAILERALPTQEAQANINLARTIPQPGGSTLQQIGVQGADVLGTQKASATLEAAPSPISKLLGAAAGLALAPVTGGLSGTLLGGAVGGLSGLFGGGSGGGASGVFPGFNPGEFNR